jgi:hypothetical protein
LEEIGFRSLIPSGSFCAILESSNASLLLSSAPEIYSDYSFYFGGINIADLRSILGIIETQSTINIKVYSWNPKS